MIEKAQTPNFDTIIRNNWPDNHNEDSYAQISHGEMETAGKTAQGVDAVQQMASAVTSTMTGLTADAATDRFAEHTSNLTQRGEFHGRRAVVAGLHVANITRTKGQLNAIATDFETQSEGLKVKSVAYGWPQAKTQAAYNELVDTHQKAADDVGGKFRETNDELNQQFTEGNDPSVPASMSGTPVSDEDAAGGTPSLPPEVAQQMQQLLGQGPGMAQGAVGQLGQLTSHTPGADVIQQIGSMMQGMGQGGQSTLTPEALDQLLAGQTSGGDTPGELVSDDTPKDEPEPDPKPFGGGETPPATMVGHGVENSTPSPAAQPVSATPPASAITPTTQLSGDTSVAPRHAVEEIGTRTSSSPLSPSTPYSDASADTQLSGSSTATAQSASLGSPLGGATMGGATLGGSPPGGAILGGATLGGSPMGGAVPVQSGTEGAHSARSLSSAQFPRPNLSVPSAVNSSSSRADLHGTDFTPTGIAPFPSMVNSPLEGTIYHHSTSLSTDERSAGTVIASLISSFAHGGLSGPVGVAILDDGTSVFSTADGLGFIPRGTRLPENVIPLSEFPSAGELFRSDMTGCVNPGHVLKIATDVGIIPSTRVIVATDEGISGNGVVRINPGMLKGAPYLTTPVTRDMFSGVSDDDVPLALESLKQAWNMDPDPDGLTVASLDLFDSRWDRVNEEHAISALVRYLIIDAQICVEKGLLSEAAYVLRQLLYLPTP